MYHKTSASSLCNAILNMKENLEIVTLSFFNKELIIKFASASENPTNHERKFSHSISPTMLEEPEYFTGFSSKSFPFSLLRV